MLTFSKPKVKQDAANYLKFEWTHIAARMHAVQRLRDTFLRAIGTRIRFQRWNHIHHINQGYSAKKAGFRVNCLTLTHSEMLVVYGQIRDCLLRQPN